MGITNLAKFIKTYAPDTIKDITLKDLEDKVIAIDTSIVLYQFLVAISSQQLKTSDGKITSHIHAIITKALSLVKKKIKPIFVFDGVAPDLKSSILEERKNIKLDAKKALDSELSDEDKLKYLKRSVYLTKEQMMECKEILTLIGIPVINAPGEADPQCAYLVKNDIADGVISEDMDLLTFGCKQLIRGSTQNAMKVYNINKLLTTLDITYQQFIDLCVLMGCDYTSTIQGIGMKRAFDLLKKYGSIESIIENEPKIKKGVYVVPIDFRYKEAKAYFLNPPIHKVDEKDIKWCEPNYTQLEYVLKNKYQYQQSTINTIVHTLKSGYYSVMCNKQTKEDYVKKNYNQEPMFI